MMIMMVVFWVLVIAGGVAIFRWLSRSRHGGQRSEAASAGDAALEIAKQRYAKGEISREEFEQLKRDLE